MVLFHSSCHVGEVYEHELHVKITLEYHNAKDRESNIDWGDDFDGKDGDGLVMDLVNDSEAL